MRSYRFFLLSQRKEMPAVSALEEDGTSHDPRWVRTDLHTFGESVDKAILSWFGQTINPNGQYGEPIIESEFPFTHHGLLYTKRSYLAIVKLINGHSCFIPLKMTLTCSFLIKQSIVEGLTSWFAWDDDAWNNNNNPMFWARWWRSALYDAR